MAHFDDCWIRNRHDLKQFEATMPLEQRLPERSILDVFIGAAARQPDQAAITMLMSGAPDEEPRRVTYAQLLDLVYRAANLFTDLGGPRPGVAYMLPSLIETHVTLWGAETAGYAVPINFLLQAEHIAALIEASGAKILVALGPHPALDIWQKALEVQKRSPGLCLVRVSPPGTPAEAGLVDLGEALAGQPADRLVAGEPGRNDDVAAYFHTGGTTGTPKLVAHTHRSQLVAALGGAAMGNYRPSDIMTATLPLFHVAGTIFCGLSAFMAGLELLIMSPGGLRTPAMVQGFWRLVAQYKATLVGGVPTGIGAVLEVPLDGADISAVRAGLTGAALLPPIIGERFHKITGQHLYEIYGMTEASGLIAIDPVGGDHGAGSVGWALPYTEFEVRKVDADGRPGARCAINEVGVVIISGEHVSPGYRDPAHNSGVFMEGSLNSGDLGFVDEDGRLILSGRSKDLIIRSGHNIDPVMIENAMATHPAVAVAAAVGMPDAYAGEIPVCFIELRPGTEVEMDALHKHAEQTIAERPAWPKRFEILETIPLTTVGKIYKPQLRLAATTQLVTEIVCGQLAICDAGVEAVEGGPRGMRVVVTLPGGDANSKPTVENALSAYLFESIVSVV